MDLKRKSKLHLGLNSTVLFSLRKYLSLFFLNLGPSLALSYRSGETSICITEKEMIGAKSSWYFLGYWPQGPISRKDPKFWAETVIGRGRTAIKTGGKV